MTDDCVFCKILKGEIPGRIVYEDQDVIGLLDIQPFSRGHVLVIPKKHVQFFHEMDEELTSKVFIAVNRVCEKLKKAYDVEHIDLFARGMRVPHVHIFVIPTIRGEDNIFDEFVHLFSEVQEKIENPFTEEEMDQIAEEIRNA